MPQTDKTDLRAVIPAAILILGLVFSLRGSVPVRAAAPPAITDGARQVFKTQCSLCHGQSGEGSQMGLALHVKDLRGKEVQSLSDDAIRENIIKGNPKGMPAFGDRVSKPDLDGLVALVRSLKK